MESNVRFLSGKATKSEPSRGANATKKTIQLYHYMSVTRLPLFTTDSGLLIGKLISLICT